MPKSSELKDSEYLEISRITECLSAHFSSCELPDPAAQERTPLPSAVKGLRYQFESRAHLTVIRGVLLCERWPGWLWGRKDCI